jgi:ABC-type sugar transport system ATPase subunit
VRLSKNAWLSDGQDEIRGESLKYNVLEKKMIAEGRGAGVAARAHHDHAAAAESQTMSVLRALEPRQKLQVAAGAADLSLQVESGEVVGLLGPNGAGKTTAFYMIVGLTPCEHGEIMLDNRDIGRLPMHRRAQLGLGYLPQEPSVFRRMSVEDNIMAILETRPKIDSSARTSAWKSCSRSCTSATCATAWDEPVGRRAAARRNRPRPGRRSAVHPAG